MSHDAPASTAPATSAAGGLPRAAFIVGRFSSSFSGLERTASEMANVLAVAGMPVTVFGVTCRGSRVPDDMIRPPAAWAAPPGHWRGGLCASGELQRTLNRIVPQVDVVHNHCVWILPNHYASAAAQRAGKPVIFTPHGTLDPFAVRMSAWKKRLVATWFQNRDFRRAACFHVFSQRELEGVRAYGLKQSVAIVPYGIDLGALDCRPAATVFAETYPETAGKQICLYLSRLHRKKGLEHLVQAWQRVADRHPSWHLVIAGPDYGQEADVRRWRSELGLERSLTITGALSPAHKLAAFSAASAFVLPSFSEGFSSAVIEALACHLPVLITPGCNFPEVAKREAGVEVLPNVAGVEHGLRRLLELSPAERSAMGQRGREIIERDYTWNAVLAKMTALYRWVTGGGSPPSFVELA